MATNTDKAAATMPRASFTQAKVFTEITGYINAGVGLAFCALPFWKPGFDLVNELLIPKVKQPVTLYSIVMGAVLTGYGTTLALVARNLHEGPEKLVDSMITGFLVWFVLDSAGSLAQGAPNNFVFNLLNLAMVGPAFYWLKQEAKKERRE